MLPHEEKFIEMVHNGGKNHSLKCFSMELSVFWVNKLCDLLMTLEYSNTSLYLQIADRSAVTCDPATFSCFMLQHFLSRLLRQGKKSFCLEQGGLRFWHQNLKENEECGKEIDTSEPQIIPLLKNNEATLILLWRWHEVVELLDHGMPSTHTDSGGLQRVFSLSQGHLLWNDNGTLWHSNSLSISETFLSGMLISMNIFESYLFFSLEKSFILTSQTL